jgi:hypothetical protein
MLHATSLPEEGKKAINRVLCPYPKRAVWDGTGNVDMFESWSCVE